uniref:Transposase Tc1-like domain-containing protein n=1 Tax=Poecilia formosa TaxID=48698 RepID=A0A087X5Y2_POEFO
TIITLKNEGQSVQKIGKTLKVSPSAVAKTIKRYKETGSHEDRPRKGRPGVTSAAEDKFIRVTSLRNRRLTAAQIRDQVNATQSSSSRHISATTVKRRLCESGLHGRIATRKPLLRTSNKQKRLVWAKQHKEWTLDQWTSVLWSDESKFVIFGSNHRVFV